MKKTFVFVILLILALQISATDSDSFYDQVMSYLTKYGFKVATSPAVLKKEIEIVSKRIIKTAVTQSTLKKIPIVGTLFGIGLGVWRMGKGQFGLAAAQVTSGVVGSTGVGALASFGIDIGILVVDIVEELRTLGLVQKK